MYMYTDENRLVIKDGAIGLRHYSIIERISFIECSEHRCKWTHEAKKHTRQTNMHYATDGHDEVKNGGVRSDMKTTNYIIEEEAEQAN